MQSTRRKLFGIEIDALKMPDAVDRLRDWIESDQHQVSKDGKRQTCRSVVTPNVDHAVLLNENGELRSAYADAEMILADGHPIVWASRLLHQPLPERVPGSELVPKLFESFNQRGRLKVFLLGAAEGVAAKAAENMKATWPNIETVGVYSPPVGFEKDEAECEHILGLIADCRPDVIVVGLGAPKQELWVHRYKSRLHASAALCVGATIDFLAGEKKRAPVWMQRGGIEWLHRMCSEPKRLIKRYARDAWIFPQLVLQQMFGAQQSH